MIAAGLERNCSEHNDACGLHGAPLLGVRIRV
jgi:hypothetical protein